MNKLIIDKNGEKSLNQLLVMKSNESEFDYQNRLAKNAFAKLYEYEESGLSPYDVKHISDMLKRFVTESEGE